MPKSKTKSKQIKIT